MSAPDHQPERPRADRNAIRAALAMYQGAPGQVSVDVLHRIGGAMSYTRYGTTGEELDRAARDVVKTDAADEPVGIYVRGTTVDPNSARRGLADESVAWVAIRADLDLGKPGGPQRWNELFDAFGRTALPAPTEWQHSGGGYYPLFRLAAPVPDGPEIRATAKAIERELRRAWAESGFTAGVDACADAARVWRLAGTVHRKNPGSPVLSTVGKPTGRTFTLAELTADLPEPPAEPTAVAHGEFGDRAFTAGQAETFMRRHAIEPVTASVYGVNVNNTLNAAALIMGHFVPAFLDEDQVYARLEAALLAGPGRAAGWKGLDATDRATIRSGLAKGASEPYALVETPAMPLLVADGPCEDGYVLDGLTEPWEGNGQTARHRTGPGPVEVADDGEAFIRAKAADDLALRGLAIELGSEAAAKTELRERALREARHRLDVEARPVAPPFEELVVWDDDLESIPPPRMVIPDLLPERGVGWLGGPSGSYKSFVAVSLATGLGYGTSVLDRPGWVSREKHKVLYVAGEGKSGVALRMRALRHHLGVSPDRRVALYPRAADLTNEREVERLTDYLVDLEFTWVVIDTFRQSTLGVNENDNTEVGVIIGRLLGLRDTHGIGAILVDHTNKSAQGLADLGGAGAKRANTDFVLMVDLPNGDRSVGEQRVLRAAKFKDKQDGQTWPIRLESTPDVTDDDGDACAVAVVGEVATGGSTDIHGDEAWRQVELPADVTGYEGAGREALNLVSQIVMHYGSGESGVSRAEVVTYYRAAVPGVSKTAAQKRVNKAWDALHELGRLGRTGGGSSTISAHAWLEK